MTRAVCDASCCQWAARLLRHRERRSLCNFSTHSGPAWHAIWSPTWRHDGSAYAVHERAIGPLGYASRTNVRHSRQQRTSQCLTPPEDSCANTTVQDRARRVKCFHQLTSDSVCEQSGKADWVDPPGWHHARGDATGASPHRCSSTADRWVVTVCSVSGVAMGNQDGRWSMRVVSILDGAGHSLVPAFFLPCTTGIRARTNGMPGFRFVISGGHRAKAVPHTIDQVSLLSGGVDHVGRP